MQPIKNFVDSLKVMLAENKKLLQGAEYPTVQALFEGRVNALTAAISALEAEQERQRPYTEEEREERQRIPMHLWTPRDWADESRMDMDHSDFSPAVFALKQYVRR